MDRVGPRRPGPTTACSSAAVGPGQLVSEFERLLPSGFASAASVPLDDPGKVWPEERALIEHASPTRRSHYLTGRACAHRAIGQIGVVDAPILSGGQGEPLWPAGCTGSISHCDALVMAVCGSDQIGSRIGIDVEVRHGVSSNVAGLICTAEEREWCAQASVRLGDLGWETLIFSGKESAFKAWSTPEGGRPDYRSVQVEIRPEFGARGSFSVAGALHGSASPLHGQFLITASVVATYVVRPVGGDPLRPGTSGQ